ncbi:MAG: D-alanyl-D-alanine carboxypeptidase family protein [Limnochordia bacterium]|jgi:D-alanyl-D-alanine carboxypeptidase (penicillin-binding protein 5/6)|nr:D-alanyl-D-alanine carboxypeptidase family protein [Bacillota bacterium]NLH30249.1 D-alanyl-D-alanine carboxypeptidase [Bacillota bacterium]HOB08405.1 D-alanyl-D-alanine carboxypeptidase family protein [Limnochordia bacterium]HPZ30854.1 D-alanyl-D-alanine carboxypeptidase family protein [Limnochordia bacterium]HQD70452.1 D-alanyl-D-alanine carboxypeptidase family protein [Limnochordia bacterium]
MRSRFVTLLIAVFLSIGCFSPVLAQNFAVDAEIGLLYDFDSEQVLFAQDADKPWTPASLVKVMTLFVAFDRIKSENIDLNSQVTVSERAWQMGGSQMFLEVGDKVTFDDLLRGIAVVSGNDACVAIAEALAGTEELYVQWMNSKAEELGLNLHFVDVHGLSDANQITALDFAKLVKAYLTDHPQALEYHSQLSFSYQPRSSRNPIVQANRNGLLKSYEGADGLKTGHLSSAGYNLVATAERDGRRLVAVILGATSEAKREQEAAKALDYGFRSFESVSVDQLLPQTQARVYKGRSDYVALTTDGARVTVLKGSRDKLSVDAKIEVLQAPIAIGEKVGTLTVYLNGEVLKEAPLFAAGSVERGNWFTILVDSIVLFFKKLFS